MQVINGSLWIDHLPWRNYEGGVVPHALTPDKYNECVAFSSAQIPVQRAQQHVIVWSYLFDTTDK